MTEQLKCPSALNIKGEHFPCQTMEQMAPDSLSHDGWAHSNGDAGAVWGPGHDPLLAAIEAACAELDERYPSGVPAQVVRQALTRVSA